MATLLNTQDESRVKIAKVDCTENQITCQKNDVTSYPTLKFFKENSDEAIKFRGQRDLPSLTQFINDQLGSSTPEDEEVDEDDNVVVPAPLKSLIELTDSNFAQVSSGKWFVKFYGKFFQNLMIFSAFHTILFSQLHGAVTAKSSLRLLMNWPKPWNTTRQSTLLNWTAHFIGLFAKISR